MKTIERSSRHRLGAAAIGAAMVGGTLLAVSPATPAFAASTTFTYTGGAESWLVPAGVSAVRVVANGAPGLAGGGGGGLGGAASTVTATVNVTPGTSLMIFVGGNAGKNGGAAGGAGTGGNGAGGAGGDATTVGTSSAAGDQLVVAGGGGGGGGQESSHAGGVGGGAGQTAGNGGGGAGNGGNGGKGGTQGYLKGAAGGKGAGTLQFSGGGGGGGGGGVKSGDGGGGGGGFTGKGAGGGGGGGTSSATGTNVTFGTTTGAASVTITSVDITTSGLPDGMTGEPYVATLTAASGTGPYTWTLTSGSLPAGLTLAADGNIGGLPTAVGSSTATFKATDANGAATSASFTIDVQAPPVVDAVVLDDPATAITQNTATGNGRVFAGSTAVTSIFCRIATTAGGVPSGTEVAATPGTAAPSTNTPVTCPFAGLADKTMYYYNVYAVDGTGTHDSAAAQSFTTLDDPTNNQTADISPPARLANNGKTVLLPRTTLTNADQAVEVSVRQVGKNANKSVRGDVGKRVFKVIRKGNGKVIIQTFGKKAKLRVTYSAPATSGYTAFSEIYHYVVK